MWHLHGYWPWLSFVVAPFSDSNEYCLPFASYSAHLIMLKYLTDDKSIVCCSTCNVVVGGSTISEIFFINVLSFTYNHSHQFFVQSFERTFIADKFMWLIFLAFTGVASYESLFFFQFVIVHVLYGSFYFIFHYYRLLLYRLAFKMRYCILFFIISIFICLLSCTLSPFSIVVSTEFCADILTLSAL